MKLLTHDSGKPILAWTEGVPVDEGAIEQLHETASLPFIHHHIAVMPDVHWGKGSTIGSVIPTLGAIVPAAVGVDIGCGMMAVRTDLPADRLPDNLVELRSRIESAVPHGRTNNGGAGDRGAWHDIPEDVERIWVSNLMDDFADLTEKEPGIEKSNHVNHLGTLGGGNHFVEVCLDENRDVWFMLHSGSRGVGNRIGMTYIKRAQKEAGPWWAQRFAELNREIMMASVVGAATSCLPPFQLTETAINCHHNYVARENHFGKNVWLTRKGAVRARKGDLGIIPGSMGAKSYIVRGLGNPDSFNTCSHGAGRVMSRREAKRTITVEDHEKATQGVECRKDGEVLDESPAAYKDIDAVMDAQKDLVEVLHTLKQVVCVKG